VKNFIKIIDKENNTKLLNVNYIISVEPYVIKNFKLGEKDIACTRITSVGAMVSTTIVYDSVDVIEDLIKATLL
jgi:predicted metallopeptidase